MADYLELKHVCILVSRAPYKELDYTGAPYKELDYTGAPYKELDYTGREYV